MIDRRPAPAAGSQDRCGPTAGRRAETTTGLTDDA